MWAESFSHRLGIRPSTQHASCSECQRHKLIIRKLGADRRARDAQIALYAQHLRLQYADRVAYWQSRAVSRMQSLQPSGLRNLTIILDGIDHSKFRYPRSQCLTAKEFAVYPRPAMDVHGVLAHGFGMFLALSEPFTPKDSSWCSELLMHTLHRVASRGHDVRTMEIFIQADNTSREVKNNTVTRLAALLTGAHRAARVEVRCLMKGHSHEDLDQFFSSIATLIESHRELHSPDQFVQMLNRYLQQPEVRPHEGADKAAFMVHQVRDWSLDGLSC